MPSFSDGEGGGSVRTKINSAIATAEDLDPRVTALESGKAALASPAFTGTPTAPTATGGTNTTQIATTAFVQGEISASGGGDMLKSVYDTDDDGKVDAAVVADGVVAGGIDDTALSGVTATQTAMLRKLGLDRHCMMTGVTSPTSLPDSTSSSTVYLVRFATREYDSFPAINAYTNCAVMTSGGEHNGYFYINEPGVYRFQAQMYLFPPLAVECSVYLNLYYNGTTSSPIAAPGTAQRVGNVVTRPGQHPHIHVDRTIRVSAADQYYSFGIYQFNTSALTATIETGAIYAGAVVSRLS